MAEDPRESRPASVVAASWLRHQAPRPSCGNDMLYLAKLPAIGFRVLYKSSNVKPETISSKEPEEAVVKGVAL